MLRMTGITEENWTGAASLSVREDQKGYLASAVGILARGYVYRDLRGRVILFEDGGVPVGLALVRDFSEEPLGYDLQQFMIDRRYQGRGYGSLALAMLLEDLGNEGRYDRVEVCVKRENAAALRLFRKHGFRDSGYVDPSLPDSVILVLSLRS